MMILVVECTIYAVEKEPGNLHCEDHVHFMSLSAVLKLINNS